MATDWEGTKRGPNGQAIGALFEGVYQEDACITCTETVEDCRPCCQPKRWCWMLILFATLTGLFFSLFVGFTTAYGMTGDAIAKSCYVPYNPPGIHDENILTEDQVAKWVNTTDWPFTQIAYDKDTETCTCGGSFILNPKGGTNANYTNTTIWITPMALYNLFTPSPITGKVKGYEFVNNEAYFKVCLPMSYITDPKTKGFARDGLAYINA